MLFSTRAWRRLLTGRTSPPRPPQLHMRRSLEQLPALVVPSSCRLRSLESSDEAAWASLLAENGELGAWSPARAAPYFGPGAPMLLAGSYFLLYDGTPIATAQLHLHHDDEYAPMPELGWVAVSPAHRGQGLGYVVCLAVLHHAVQTDHHEIFLRTDDHRFAAIATYLKLGFEPWLPDVTAPKRWHRALSVTQTSRSTIP
jgi:mycothiol synthase